MKYVSGGVTGVIGEGLVVQVPLRGTAQQQQQSPQQQSPQQQSPQQQQSPASSEGLPPLAGLDTAWGHNGNVKWDDVPNYYSFIIIKASQHLGEEKKGFRRYWDLIGKQPKLLRGGYHFWTCDKDDGDQQAKLLKKVMSDIRPGVDFPPCLDLEFSGKKGKPKLEEIGHAEGLKRFAHFWKAVVEQFGIYPMIYTSGRVWHEDLDDAPLPIKEMIHSPIWCKGGGGKKKNSNKISGGYVVGKGKTLEEAQKVLARSSPDIPNPKPWGSRNYWIKQYGGDCEAELCHFGDKGGIDLNHFQLLGSPDSEKSGERVKWVQRRLKGKGIAVSVSGDWNDETIEGVKQYQNQLGLPVRGIVDPGTFVKLAWEQPSSDGI